MTCLQVVRGEKEGEKVEKSEEEKGKEGIEKNRGKDRQPERNELGKAQSNRRG